MTTMKKEKNYVSIHDHYERRKKLCIVPVLIFQNILENTSKKKQNAQVTKKYLLVRYFTRLG